MKLEIGTEVVINDKAPTNRYPEITFVDEMERQLGKRGTIIQCEEFSSTNIYQIQTEDGKKWWYRPEWFHEAQVYTGF